MNNKHPQYYPAKVPAPSGPPERARRKMRISASADAPAQHVTTVELLGTERIAATGCTLEQHIRLGLQEKREAVAP